LVKQHHSLSTVHSERDEHIVFQEAINQIVCRFYRNRNLNKMHLLTYIHEFTRSKAFLGTSSQIASLAILSNHLLQFVTPMNPRELFLISDPKPIFIKELNATLFVKLDIGKWIGEGYILKKFIWREIDFGLVVDVVMIYCHYAYIKQPRELEICNLYFGTKSSFELVNLNAALDRVKKRIDSTISPIIEGDYYFITSNKKGKDATLFYKS
jgi:hypothetical protein